MPFGNISTTSTASTVAFSSNVLWANWNIGITSGTGSNLIIPTTTAVTTSCTSTIWTSWNQSFGNGNVVRVATHQPAVPRPPTEFEIARNLAKDKAAKLLDRQLSDKQREQLKDKGHFDLEVLSNNGQRRMYRIERRWAGSVHQIDPATGKKLKTLCIHPRINTPVEDSMLAQKLMLESGMEEEFLRIANHTNWT